MRFANKHAFQLHQLALCFYEDECRAENLVEYHIFEYAYHGGGVTMSVHSKGRSGPGQTMKCTFEDVKERTVHMIRACVVIMQSCQQELPPCYDISLRLYYNEEAPEEYQAPGFLRAEEPADHLAPSLADAVLLGCVDTPYHRMLARSYIRDGLASSRDAIASQNPPIMTQNETPELSGSSRRSSLEGTKGGISCPCNKYCADDAEDPTELITCVYCRRQQHAACFGVAPERAVLLQRHCCARCSDGDPSRVPTDPRLASLAPKQRECLCTFRRTLRWCWAWGEASAALLRARGIPAAGAQRLLRLLRNHRLLPDLPDPARPDSPQKINREQLRAVMEKFFASAPEQGIVDRLLAETFASQESTDPLGELLSPVEKISLQKAATVGRVVEPVQHQPAAEDATLREYRDAVFSKGMDDHEMPLSTILSEGKTSKGKRKIEEREKANLRTGVRTKKARTLK
ncbi:unnamed protein product, partial [Iphiclides podalirius]